MPNADQNLKSTREEEIEASTCFKRNTDNKGHMHSRMYTHTPRLWTGPATPLRL